MPPATVAPNFWCPRCQKQPLERFAGGFKCSGCARDFPFLGGVPCLVDDPELFRHAWLARLSAYTQVVSQRIDAIATDPAPAERLPATTARVRRSLEALRSQRASVRALLSGLLPSGATEPQAGLPTASPTHDLAALQYYEHLFRDWVWGTAECNAQLEFVSELGPPHWGTVAVYGAGAGRLAVDVHQTLGPTRTLAFDLNPLPLFVLSRLLLGASLELREFPIAPLSADDVVVTQTLECPFRVRDGFEAIFADALRPPLADGSLDSVLTPWFIDAVDADLEELAAAINAVLRPGGSWVNVGPLRFERSLAQNYVFEEVLEIVARAGFEVSKSEARPLPYFASPHSGEHRIDRVFGFRATKTSSVPPPPARPRGAPWLSDPSLPIPQTARLSELNTTSAFTAGITSMIDGKRSIRDLAVALSGQLNMPSAALESELLSFFAGVRLD